MSAWRMSSWPMQVQYAVERCAGSSAILLQDFHPRLQALLVG